MNRMLFLGFFLLIFAAGGPLSSSAQSARGNVFEVEAKIFAGDQQIGQPKITLFAGSEGVMNLTGPRGYGLRLTVDDDIARSGVNDPVKLSARIYFSQNNNWVLVGTPSMQIGAGTSSSISSSASNPYDGSGYTFEVTVRRTDRVATAADFGNVEECLAWKELATDGPLEGVKVRGTMTASCAAA